MKQFLGYFLCGLVIMCVLTPLSQTQAQEVSKQRVWGYIFGDLYWKVDGDEARWGRGEYMGTEKGMMGGALRRLYLGYDHKISDQFTTRVLLESNQGTLMPNGSYGAIIKLGYLQWNAPNYVFYNQKFAAGLIPTPVFTFPQDTWGYRSVEKEALDARGIGRSVDQGMSYSASFDKDNNYGFTFMIGNGSGTRPATDKYFEYTGSMFMRLFDKSLTLETMANYKYQGDGMHSNIFRGFLGYQTGILRFGFEAAYIEENLNNGVDYIKRNPFLYSAFYAFKLNVFQEEIEFFARYDKYNPDLNFNNNMVYPNDLRFVYDQSLVILGATYNPIPAISIMPNIYINIYDDKRDVNVDRKNDIVLRFTLYYRY